MPQVDIITGEARRRTWTQEEKQSILTAAFAPGAVTAHVAKRLNVSTGQLYTWRKELGRYAPPAGRNGFARVVAISETAVAVPPLVSLPKADAALAAAPSISPLPVPVEQTASPPSISAAAYELPAIEVEVGGNKVRIPGSMPPALATAVLRALVRR